MTAVSRLFSTQYNSTTELSLYLTRTLSKAREYNLVADDAQEGVRSRKDRDKAWSDIHVEVKALSGFGPQLTRQEDRDRLAAILGSLDELRSLQETCFQVCQLQQPETIVTAGHCFVRGNAITANIRDAINFPSHFLPRLIRKHLRRNVRFV